MRLAATVGDRQVTLSWDAPVDNGGSPVTRYSIYRGLFVGGEAFLEEVGNVLTYTDTDLRNGQTYYYRVSAANPIGEGAKSDALGAIPLARPGAPIAVSAAPGNGEVMLSWLSPVETGGASITHFSIYRGLAPGTETYVASTAGDTHAYRDIDVENGVRYYYRVTASNPFGEGEMSTQVAATPSVRDVSTIPGLPVLEQALLWILLAVVVFTAFAAVVFARRRRAAFAKNTEAKSQIEAPTSSDDPPRRS